MRLTNFNPLSPYGERRVDVSGRKTCGDFNPRSPYGERRLDRGKGIPHLDFNPRSPYGERLPNVTPDEAAEILFQSTLPVWGATAKRCVCANSSPAYCIRPISSRLRKAESAGNMLKNWCEATQQCVRSSPSHPTNKLQG